ncbi:MAG: HAMP domain-containing sensor histidine kinase [Acidocella sp.]|nr:HAMP domain-containing sensor histidine kinase [Acidocella sp.]
MRLLRISGFRFAMQSAALSLFGAIIVFGIIYRAAEDTVRNELDNTVISEQADVISDTQDDHKSIAASVDDAITDTDGTFYALTTADHRVITGNLTVSARVEKNWKHWATLDRDDGMALPAHVTAIRGLATTMPNGDILYVAENASTLHALDHLIARAFLAVFGTISALSLAGGLLVARGTLARVDAFSGTSQEIMSGDLSRRLALTGSGDEFDRLAISLNSMLARIQTLMENLKQVTNDIAHDLRSPLARLREHLELARQSTAEPATRLAFDDAMDQVDTALAIFSSLLRIAEIEAGARRADFKLLDLSTLVANLAETFETVADAEDKRLLAAITPGLAIIGDKELLTQMLVNLIENAIRHTGPGAEIRLEAQPGQSGFTDVIIADNGPGIPKDKHQQVLLRFVRLDNARLSPGSGLGLALVKAVIDLHNGGIILSDQAPGLKVTVSLRATP